MALGSAGFDDYVAVTFGSAPVVLVSEPVGDMEPARSPPEPTASCRAFTIWK